ncbi:MAG: peptidase S58 [Herpetosiphonaceae bacterium]|nr:MAG: peptidase S58 [Herpetosiphonaceae bacterium]
MPGLAEIAGLSVGHWTDTTGRTGCTVVLCPDGAIAAVDVRGGAPGTRETDLLQPGRLVQQINAVLLTGGSAFGLAAADGVVRWLEEHGYGFQTPVAHVPIVPAAVLFDLGVGDPHARPDAAAGYAACVAAGPHIPEGQIGAGTGATIGKLLGIERASPGGIGTASVRLPDGTIVGAIVAVNSFGHVVDPTTGTIIAGPRGDDGAFVDSVAALLQGHPWSAPPSGSNTTIGVVVTNASLDRAACARVASQAHNGLARSIRPAHSLIDGDTIFVLTLPRADAGPADPLLVGTAAAEAVAEAVVRAARAAASGRQPLGSRPV